MGVLERSRALYEDLGAELIRRLFPEYESRIAVGLAGHGSECFGFDDEVSLDHDCAPGFMLWLNDRDYAAVGGELQKAYLTLTPEAEGAKGLRGVQRIGGFYRRYTGSEGAPESWRQWLSLPSWALAEATNGQVWRDDAGVFSALRERLLHGMPEDVRKKRLAALTLSMAQSGQYNYSRCLAHAQEGAAMLALCEFVSSVCETVYLLNRAYMPYYKWSLRGMERLDKLRELQYPLEFLLTAENDRSGQGLKAGLIEDISAAVIAQLKAQRLTDGDWDYLEPHAYEIMERIENREIRALHIMD